MSDKLANQIKLVETLAQVGQALIDNGAYIGHGQWCVICDGLCLIGQPEQHKGDCLILKVRQIQQELDGTKPVVNYRYECPDCGGIWVEEQKYTEIQYCPICAGDRGDDIRLTCRQVESPDHQDVFTSVSGALAAKFLERRIAQGHSVEIPSLGIVLKGDESPDDQDKTVS
jgi:hypothetical protein